MQNTNRSLDWKATGLFFYFRIFDSKAYMLINKQFRTKFEKKSKEMILVGYELGQKAYKLGNVIHAKQLQQEMLKLLRICQNKQQF